MSFAVTSIFPLETSNFFISRNTVIDYILIHNFYFFTIIWTLKGYFNKYGYNFGDASKICYSRLSYKFFPRGYQQNFITWLRLFGTAGHMTNI